ncbi:MHYT domain-containing protein [Yinghuangia sp. YIM S10712]|uniref:MHYT domain-containing protein n=1 Tax=Yinghuangia sp. YIM S10712 TaxID=3436930 RepID=UPI003F52D103
MNHFTYGPVTPGLAFLMSCVGACLGLLCSSRAQATQGGARWRWLVLAALSLGGTGIWVMHFIAMLGFSMPGSKVRYDVPLTLASMCISVIVVGIGLALAIGGVHRRSALFAGGGLTGTGVAGMHYLGMAAMDTSRPVTYDTRLVALSLVVAIVASTAALWAALYVRGLGATFAAAPVMGLAVCGMHYIGMFAMRTGSEVPEASPHAVHGAEPVEFLAPLITGISVVTLVILVVVAIWPNVEQMADDRDFDVRVSRLTRMKTTV